MLQELTIKNFKLFDEEGVTLRPARITVLVGCNATGKSSVLQALLLLKQSMGHEALQLKGPYFDFDDYRRAVHLQQEEREIEIGLTAAYAGFPSLPKMSPALPSDGSFQYHGLFGRERVVYVIGSIECQGESLRCTWGPEGTQQSHEKLVVPRVATFALGVSQQIAHPFVIVQHSFLEEGKRAEQRGLNTRQALERLFSTIDQLLGETQLISALRGFDARAYDILPQLEAEELDRAGSQGQQAGRIANELASEPELGDQVAEWLSALGPPVAMGTRLVAGRLAAEARWEKWRTNWVDEAFGPNQLVHLFVRLAKAAHGSLVGIEEPEIHLHPAAQAALCDVLLDIATREQKQLILTTHSEHIVMGFLTAVARGDLKPDDLAVYEFRREGDTATAERLDVNEYGQIEGGLRGFFEVDLEHLTEVISARLRPKGQ